jgi:hypothetical protein
MIYKKIYLNSCHRARICGVLIPVSTKTLLSFKNNFAFFSKVNLRSVTLKFWVSCQREFDWFTWNFAKVMSDSFSSKACLRCLIFCFFRSYCYSFWQVISRDLGKVVNISFEFQSIPAVMELREETYVNIWIIRSNLKEKIHFTKTKKEIVSTFIQLSENVYFVGVFIKSFRVIKSWMHTGR